LERSEKLTNSKDGELSSSHRAIIHQNLIVLRDQLGSLSENHPAFPAKDYESKIGFIAHYAQIQASFHPKFQMSAAERAILSSRAHNEVSRKRKAERQQLLGPSSASTTGSQPLAVANISRSDPRVPSEVRRRQNAAATSSGVDAQDDVVDDMAGLVSHLKKNVVAIQETLQKDSAVREIVEQKLDAQMPRVIQETERLTAHLASAQKTTLLTYFIIVMVSIIFFATYVFMKVVPKPR
jgi:hypothetical protein